MVRNVTEFGYAAVNGVQYIKNHAKMQRLSPQWQSEHPERDTRINARKCAVRWFVYVCRPEDADN